MLGCNIIRFDASKCFKTIDGMSKSFRNAKLLLRISINVNFHRQDVSTAKCQRYLSILSIWHWQVEEKNYPVAKKVKCLIFLILGITGTCVHDNLWFWNVHKNSCRWVYPAQRKLPQKSVEHHGLHSCRFRVSITFCTKMRYSNKRMPITLGFI